LQLNQQPVVIENGEISVQIQITNTGSRAGSEVVQVYLRGCVASLVRPVHELKAFQRVKLNVGETVTLNFSIPTDMLNFTNAAHKRIVEPGFIDVQVGASSADIRANGKVTLAGKVRELPRNWRMVSRCEVNQ
jgi:beta-xylosidase